MTPTSPGELELVSPATAEPHGEDHDQQHDSERLEKLALTWPARAGVRKSDLDPGVAYDDAKPDFLTELLPFHDHPIFLRAPEPYRQAVLSCGWLAYNEKTVAIESKIVSPACMHLIDGDVDGFPRHRYCEAVSQALIDESYHILLVLQANGVTRQRRRLTRAAHPLLRACHQHAPPSGTVPRALAKNPHPVGDRRCLGGACQRLSAALVQRPRHSAAQPHHHGNPPPRRVGPQRPVQEPGRDHLPRPEPAGERILRPRAGPAVGVVRQSRTGRVGIAVAADRLSRAPSG